MTPLVRTGFAALALAALPLLGGCGEAEDKQSAPVTQDDATLTLAAALGANKALGILQSAIEQSELSGVLDGRASYTVLAPKDRAFAALGKNFGRRFYAEIITDGRGYSATELEFRVTSWLSLLAAVSTVGRESVVAEISRDY
jgi:hypothetical protein